jgi:hypothetical protein
MLYRGPLVIETGQAIFQFADPFGNLFGLIGPCEGAFAHGTIAGLSKGT